MMTKVTRLAAALSTVLALGCDGEIDRPDYGALFEEVEAYLWDHGYEDGDWDPDWDDAPFYGLAFYSQVGWAENRGDYKRRAREALAHNLEMAEEGIGDPSGALIDNMSGIVFGALGIVEYMAVTGDEEPLETLDLVIDLYDSTVDLMGNYVEGMDNYSFETYGPTAINAVIVMLELQYAVLLETERRGERVARAEEIVATIDERAWNGTFYQFDPSNTDELFLYPNVAMMIVHLRLYQATGEEAHLERAELVYEGIQPLRCPNEACPDRAGYRSPYSAEVMGAQTDDYTTLSSTNYALLAFSLLAQETGDPTYRSEIDELLAFVEEYLWVPGDGRIYHHWMDGRLAVPEDPEYYCAGCNLQLLYIIFWIHNNLGLS